MLKKMTTMFDKGRNDTLSANQNNNSDEDGGRPPRSGKELWAIAREGTYNKMKKKDLAHSMMEALKAERLRKQ